MSQQTASFAAGCFWGVEARFREQQGVLDAVSGYMGGHKDNPTYKEVCTGNTGHTEAVQVTYDDEQISYAELVDLFFDMHNPTTLNRQGPDFGSQYRSAIFWHNEAQHTSAGQKIRELDASGKWSSPVVTEVKPADTFWRAEEYHQRYFEKNGGGFCHV
ncbi:MAG: peptide-methionine (S)-S-oxide reductase MsrA [Xanthomonadales bacterium]|nr:peptide-methionine (S)-S-oxide reductase MsrA [Gammaproteobacteria bacterium]MBT8054119.1 peptide-methionine (S)-S-oxide reductase MsrA [Gammaproteobacteria bacterium]NND56130.1 peptide-methionine (S)-S-oxide reductase MsrA [Xanthomonadales bacterium]NNK51643.1 peptide-methionine (S)-S-oxide reductase MsrA [Xanthomonadales bacterium]